MKFYYIANVDKGKRYVEALENAGHDVFQGNTNFTGWEDYDAILGHLNYNSRQALFRKMKAAGKRIFLYPHSTNCECFYDGVYPSPNKVIDAIFTFGEGQKRVMETIGVTTKIIPCGWSYGPLKPFSPQVGNNLLFCPIHINNKPSKRGWALHPVDKELNRKAFDLVYSLKDEYNVTIRLENPEESGIPVKSGVVYDDTPAARRNNEDAMTEILKSSAVVGRVTIAFIAIGLGIPTAMFAETHPWHNIYNEGAKNWHKYVNLRKYPLDIFNTKDVSKMMKRIKASEHFIVDWKRDFLGGHFDAKKFVDTIEGFF